MDGWVHLAQSSICGLNVRLYRAEQGAGGRSGASTIAGDRDCESLNHSPGSGSSKVGDGELGKEK